VLYHSSNKRKQAVARCDVDERELIRSGRGAVRCGVCSWRPGPALPCPALSACLSTPTPTVLNAHTYLR
jgi:hypothetical protein